MNGLAAAPASGWPMYQRDLSRSGSDPHAQPLGTVHQAWQSPALDGAIYAQPLVNGQRVLVATEGDTVYALDAATGRIAWQRHLGDPVPRAALPCGNIDPTGITGTPVIDQRLGLLFAVAFVKPGRHELAALDLATGAVVYQRPVDPPGANPLVEQQRAALALSHGIVYVAFGGLFGDCGTYHGYVVGAPEDGEGVLLTYRVPSRNRGGIWAPGGPTVDALGDLFVATGNSESPLLDGGFDFGNSVIRLSDDLRVVDWFAPSDWADLNRGDTDLGSTGPALLPAGLVFQIGKAGVGYLLRAGHLGGIGGAAFSGKVCTAAYGATASVASYLYVACTDGLVALRLRGATFEVAWRSQGFSPGAPIVAGGEIWALDTATGMLYGLDPMTGQARERHAVGPVAHFAAPSVADGRILVGAARTVIAFTG